jgi:tRNA dimethylallyltransferase
LILGVKFPLEKIYQKIGKRLKERIAEGMIEEVKKLHDRGVSWQRLEDFGLEYRYVSRYLRGIITKEEMLEQLEREIRHFSKRQLTWFKRNSDINWLTGENLKEKITQAEKKVKKFIN